MRIFVIALVTLGAFSGCQPYRFEKPPQPTATKQAQSTTPPAKRPRGNPAFYEVFGQRYYVMDSNVGYQERGVASWYGRKFHGNPTANGERYDMYGMTAAHKTLPLPTDVEVTNLKNGRKIVVRVNDRGPFVHNRLIDLSYTAAQQLDMIETGTTLVNVRALGASLAPQPERTTETEPTQPTAPIPAPAAAIPIGRQLYVQIGAFGQRENAERLMQQLAGQGLEDVFVLSDNNLQPILHRVRVGPVTEVEEYDGIVAQLVSLGFTDTHLVSED
jgi:rare lipoprotein A